ncbi:succinate dehydrogenase cytochrome B subunit, mitochondrial [Aspergillus udagawae]|uniref:Succinate dehydrogenase cytochrome B subunit, mitochondrial n=1 Tax=Aspergillus udagawae TaxID=91492 RepID=A0A8H3SE94_9EURO|nr:succinate dehydrogenase cytochrome B subunit, mitochondrial [Aspergillus udagawae]
MPSVMMRASQASSTLRKGLQTRLVSSSSNTENPSKILAKQRRNRPVSPHLSIIKPQIGWISSTQHHITGIALSGTLYLWATAYVLSPVFGWQLGSATMVAAFGALPVVVKVSLKAIMALPFTYHSLNGVRHLIWDLGLGLSNPAAIKSGWTVVGLSMLSGLCFHVMSFK